MIVESLFFDASATSYNNFHLVLLPKRCSWRYINQDLIQSLVNVPARAICIALHKWASVLEKDRSFIEINLLLLTVSIVITTFECREMSYCCSEMYIE